MQTIPFSDDGSPHITPNLPRKASVSPVLNNSDKRMHGSAVKGNVSFPAYLFIVCFFCILIVDICLFINLGYFSSYLYWF